MESERNRQKSSNRKKWMYVIRKKKFVYLYLYHKFEKFEIQFNKTCIISINISKDYENMSRMP